MPDKTLKNSYMAKERPELMPMEGPSLWGTEGQVLSGTDGVLSSGNWVSSAKFAKRRRSDCMVWISFVVFLSGGIDSGPRTTCRNDFSNKIEMNAMWKKREQIEAVIVVIGKETGNQEME